MNCQMTFRMRSSVRYLGLVLILLVLGGQDFLFGQRAKIGRDGIVEKPSISEGMVHDYGSFFSDSEEVALETKLKQFNASSSLYSNIL